MPATNYVKGRVARCTLNKIERKVRYYLNGISSSNAYDSYNGTAFIKSG